VGEYRPTLNEIGVKTGRPERELVFSLNKLAEQLYLEWDGLNTRSIKIMKGCEDKKRCLVRIERRNTLDMRYLCEKRKNSPYYGHRRN
jgi:hypothetical protein